MRRLIRSLLLVVVFTVSADLASAQMLIEQGKVSETVRAGETLSGQITVFNRSNEPLGVSAYMEDFVYTPPFDGQKKFLPAGTDPRSCSSWITFTPREFTLPALGKQQVNYTIRVPENVSGGYYAVMFFEKKGFTTAPEVGVRIVSRVGSLFFLEAQKSVRQAKVKDLAVTEGKLRGKVANEGDIILVVKGVYYSLDADGRAVDRGEIKGIYLPPGKSGEFAVALPEKAKAGQYTYVLTFDLGAGVAAVAEADVSISADGQARLLAVR